MGWQDLRRRGLRLALIGLGSLAFAAGASVDDIDPATLGTPIDRFVITGNDRTQERFLRKWTGLGPGRILTREALESAEQELLDRGLFREIRFSSERVEPGETELRLALHERRYTLLLPRASRNNAGSDTTGKPPEGRCRLVLRALRLPVVQSFQIIQDGGDRPRRRQHCSAVSSKS